MTNYSDLSAYTRDRVELIVEELDKFDEYKQHCNIYDELINKLLKSSDDSQKEVLSMFDECVLRYILFSQEYFFARGFLEGQKIK